MRTVSNVTPSTLTINFQNFDHIMAQQFCSNPENWGKSPKDMPPDLAESIKLLPLIYRYAPATVDRALQPVFEKIEDMPGKQITDYLDRGGVCAVEWSERIAGALPPETIKVTISRCPGNDDWRKITIEGAEDK